VNFESEGRIRARKTAGKRRHDSAVSTHAPPRARHAPATRAVCPSSARGRAALPPRPALGPIECSGARAAAALRALRMMDMMWLHARAALSDTSVRSYAL
jgi:hypothetical protein